MPLPREQERELLQQVWVGKRLLQSLPLPQSPPPHSSPSLSSTCVREQQQQQRGTISAGVGTETTHAVAADFIAHFVNHLHAGAGAPTSAASAGDFATCATGGPATGGPVRLPAPSLAVAPATPATAAESTGACAMGGPAQLPAPSLAMGPATIAQRLGRLVQHIRQGPGSLPLLVKVQEPHSHAMISNGIITRKGLLCFQR